MYDSFDMACHDDDPDLRLNIKVNSENLLPIPQKYNLGSLRLPADPSWPKIPQRKLAHDVGDLIQPPCIVPLIGTPRRSRTIVRTPQSQLVFRLISICRLVPCNSFQNKTQIQHSQQLRSRKSGSADPRFKKVTTAVKNQMTSTDPGDENCCRELRKSIEEEKTSAVNGWKESTRAQVVFQQAAERPDETKGKESIGVQTVEIESFELNADTKESERNSVATNEFGRGNSSQVKSALQTQFKADTPRLEDSSLDETKESLNHSKDLSGSAKTPQSVPQSSQGKKEHFFSLVEKKKVQVTNTPMAFNALDSVSSGQEKQQSASTQSYGVQVPSLSYRNVPVQISTKPSKSKSPRLFIDSANANLKSGSLLDNIVDVPKLELPDDAIPQFSNFIDHPNTREKKTKVFDQRMKQGKSADRSAVTGSQKKIDDSKAEQQMQFRNDKRYDRHRNSTAINYRSNDPPNLRSDENHRSMQLKLGGKYLPIEEKYCQQKNILNISGDTFIPNHDFHIYYNEGKIVENASKKLCDVIQSPRYQTVTSDSEAEKRGGFPIEEENRAEDDRRDELIQEKTNSRFYNRQQTTDSESHTSDVANEESAKGEEPIVTPETKREKNFFADGLHKSGKLQSINHKTVYFVQHRNETKTKTITNYEQCRGASTRQKRKHLMLNKKRVQSSEPQITSANRKLSRTPCLKKANSYLSRCTHEQRQKLAPDSERISVAKNQNRRTSSGCDANLSISVGSQDESSKSTVQVNKIRFISCEKTSRGRMRSGSVPHPTDLAEVKREHCIKPYERPSGSKNAKITSSLDLKKRNNLPPAKSPRAETDVPMIEKPTAIPVKTQQLLNKSYWEYYNKLKLDKMENGESPEQQYFCQVAMGAPRLKKRRTPEEIIEESIDCDTSSQTGEQMELSLPEIRTLEQCSVLSTMINNTLDSNLQPSTETIQTKQIYLNGNMRSSSDPTAGTQSAILKKLFSSRENEGSIISSNLVHKHKRSKRDSKFDDKTFKLKSIGEHPVVFFGCMAYALIVFLPMIYDYFFYEERDEYEDLSYVEIFFDYVMVSFKDVLGEFFDMMNKIFFKPALIRS